MLEVTRDKQAYPGVLFFEQLLHRRGHIPYWLWRSGIIPAGWGAYADNDEISIRELIAMLERHGLFCMAVPTIIRRFAGLEVPRRPNLEADERDPEWDGSISASFDGSAFGNGYFHAHENGFDRGDVDRVLKVVRERGAPVLMGKGYDGPEVHRQGHTAVLLPSGYLLQSAFGEGLHWARTIRQEAGYWADGGVWIHPDRWIETNRGRIRDGFKDFEKIRAVV